MEVLYEWRTPLMSRILHCVFIKDTHETTHIEIHAIGFTVPSHIA